MKAPSHVTIVKILVGTILLLCLLVYSLSFIREEMEKVTLSDVEYDLKLDSLLSLVQEKDEHTLDILYSFNEIDESRKLLQEISYYVAGQDFTVTQQRVQHRIIEKRDSVVKPAPKKKFFRRLAEAFSPSKDTEVLLNRSVEFITDTIIGEQPVTESDSVQQTMKVVSLNNQKKQKAIERNNKKLRKINEQLYTRIDSIIQSTEQQMQLNALREVEYQQDVRRKAIDKLGVIAVTAVVFSVILLFLILIDLIRIGRYRRKLEKAKEDAEELLRVRERLIMTITHDFKAPLSSIIGYADLLARLIGDERQKFYMGNIKSSSEHLLKLVNDLLDFHRLELNKLEVNDVIFNPHHLFEEIKTSFEPLATAKGLGLNYEISLDLDRNIVSDPLRIRQIVSNLLSNAIKFTIQGTVSLKVYSDGGKLCIVVSDTGKGMAAKDRERIFQEFIRLPDAQGEEGSGLGLSIVHKLIALLGGNIQVDSVEGEGSIFTVFLPARFAEGASIQEENNSSDESTPSVSKDIKILLIDDDKIQLTLTAAMLEQKNISVTCCEQLEELIEHLRDETFDVLLTDVQMPAISGFDLLKLLRASSVPQMKSIPVIAVTARSDMDREYFLKHGFTDCLHKPFSVKELYQVLENISMAPPVNVDIDFYDEKEAPTGLNISALTSFSEDDEEASRVIIETFIAETEKDLLLLREALEKEDAKHISRIAHKLIPLFTLINATEVRPLLAWLEAQREVEFSIEMKEETEKVIKEIKIVIDHIRQTLS